MCLSAKRRKLDTPWSLERHPAGSDDKGDVDLKVYFDRMNRIVQTLDNSPQLEPVISNKKKKKNSWLAKLKNKKRKKNQGAKDGVMSEHIRHPAYDNEWWTGKSNTAFTGTTNSPYEQSGRLSTPNEKLLAKQKKKERKNYFCGLSDHFPRSKSKQSNNSAKKGAVSESENSRHQAYDNEWWLGKCNTVFTGTGNKKKKKNKKKKAPKGKEQVSNTGQKRGFRTNLF